MPKSQEVAVVTSRVLVVNPNTSEVCSATILAAARSHRGPGISVEVAMVQDGPRYIETLRDEVVAASAVVRLLEQHVATSPSAFQAFIIACSSDPGLEAARATVDVPVLGIGESALLLARGLGQPYGILTNIDDDEAYMRDMARRYRLDEDLISVRAAGYSVEDFDVGREGVGQGLAEAGRRAVADGARSLCLGCAAMAGHAEDLAHALRVPVFEGVASAMLLAGIYLAPGRASCTTAGLEQ
jgi:allantoin racemase